jgi:hypothetical protein
VSSLTIDTFDVGVAVHVLQTVVFGTIHHVRAYTGFHHGVELDDVNAREIEQENGADGRSYVTSPITTSSALVFTPQAIVSTIITSSCLAHPTEVAGPEPTADVQGTHSTSKQTTTPTTGDQFWDSDMSSGMKADENAQEDGGKDGSMWGDGRKQEATGWEGDGGATGKQGLGNNALAQGAPSGLLPTASTTTTAGTLASARVIATSSEPPESTVTSFAAEMLTLMTLTGIPDPIRFESASDIDGGGSRWSEVNAVAVSQPTDVAMTDADRGRTTWISSLNVGAVPADRTMPTSTHMEDSKATYSGLQSTDHAANSVGILPTQLSLGATLSTSASWASDGAAFSGRDEFDTDDNSRDTLTDRYTERGTTSVRPSLTSIPWRQSHRARAKRRQCAQWTTITSYSTVYPQPSTSWSTTTVFETRSEIVRVPVQTLYASCGPATAAAAAVMSTTNTRQTPTFQQQAVQPTTTSAPTWAAQTDSAQQDGQHDDQQSSIEEDQEAAPYGSSPSSSGEPLIRSIDQGDSAEALTDEGATALAPQISTSAPVTSSSRSLDGTSVRAATSQPIADPNEPALTPRPTLTQGGQASTTVESNEDGKGSSASTATSAGTAIGGVVGILLLLAGILSALRWYRRRKRKYKTEQFRSSWFYGGDVALPDQDGNEKIPSTVRDVSAISLRWQTSP